MMSEHDFYLIARAAVQDSMPNASTCPIEYTEYIKAQRMAQNMIQQVETHGGNISMLDSVIGHLVAYRHQIAEVGAVKLEYITDKYPDAAAESYAALRANAPKHRSHGGGCCCPADDSAHR